MRRVVVTGMGIVSCLGNSLDEVHTSLKTGASGIRFNETYKEKGFRSQVSGSPVVDTTVIDRKMRRFMGPSAMYSYLAMEQAIAQAGRNRAGHDARHNVRPDTLYAFRPHYIGCLLLPRAR